MKKIILILCLAFFGNIVVAQDKDVPFSKDLFTDDKEGFSNAVKEIKLGDLSYYRGSDADLAKALTHFLVADKFNHYSANLNYKIGVCYLAGTQEFKALEYLEFAKKHGKGSEFDGIDFYLGQSYQIAGRYDEAIEKFKSYKETLSEKDTDQKFYINKKVSECRTGIELSKNPKRVWIDNLGPKINSEYPDFGPVISADNRVIFFTSRRPGSTGDESDDSGYEFEDIYYSTREFEGDWNEAENIGEPVNTNSHDATVGLAPDGKSLLTYHGVSRKDGNVLITKQNDDGTWMQTANIGETINTKYHESAATLSFDEKTLFFVSDKPGGYGGHDIYIANWDEESQAWGEAQNVGATLNTEYEEKGVFFHPDNKTLYFSSEGHKTIGGLDIFKSEFNAETGEWSTPENLGVPINTSSDDVYFVVSGNEKYAYYSSVKPDGYGEKDIYMITFLGDKKNPLLASVNVSNNELMANKNGLVNEFKSNKLVLLTGVVTDGNSKAPLMSDLSIVNSKTNEKITNILLDDDGSYMAVVPAGVTYAISSTKTGYTIASKTVVVDKKAEGSEIKTDLQLYPPVAGGEFVLRNIYFSFDKDDLRHVSINELDKLVKIMKENPSLVIELGGHTDRRGPESYNQSLSERRAKIAKDYLVKHGISKDRIQTKGYGESKPEISGETINNMETKREKEEAHQQNRRTVVTIISK